MDENTSYYNFPVYDIIAAEEKEAAAKTVRGDRKENFRVCAGL